MRWQIRSSTSSGIGPRARTRSSSCCLRAGASFDVDDLEERGLVCLGVDVDVRQVRLPELVVVDGGGRDDPEPSELFRELHRLPDVAADQGDLVDALARIAYQRPLSIIEDDSDSCRGLTVVDHVPPYWLG